MIFVTIRGVEYGPRELVFVAGLVLVLVGAFNVGWAYGVAAVGLVLVRAASNGDGPLWDYWNPSDSAPQQPRQ